MRYGSNKFGIILAGIFLVAVVIVPMPHSNLLWQKIFDLGHVPFFGLIAILVLPYTGRFQSLSWMGIPGNYLVTFVVIAIFGLLSELAQIPTNRDADPYDFARDLIGGFTALGIRLSLDAKSIVQVGMKPIIVTLLRWGTGILLLVVLIPLVLYLGAYQHRHSNHQYIATFDSRLEYPLFALFGSSISLVEAPKDWVGISGTDASSNALAVSFHSKNFPVIEILEPPPDWREFDFLILDVYNPLPDSKALAIRVHDKFHNSKRDDRFGKLFTLMPGANIISVPTVSIEIGAANGRLIDMSNIVSVAIFMPVPPQEITLFLRNLRLE